MSRYLVIHRDYPLRVSGVHSGAEMATLNLARFLAKAGGEVYLAAQLVDRSEEGFHPTLGATVWDLGKEYDTQKAIERVRDLGEYHLISAGRSHPFFFAKDDTQCLTRVLICHANSVQDSGINTSVLTNLVDRIICVSNAQAALYLQAGVPREKITTIRNGVDLGLFTVGAPAERDWMQLIFVGALVPDKGIDLLLVSFAELKAKYPHLKLDVYGSAKLWNREEVYDCPQLASKIPGLTFHGDKPQTAVADALKRAGICVLPSIWFEPFPLTAIEAQVTGCPVVTFDVGGLKEGVRDGETGRVIHEVSQDLLTKTLDDLLAAPEQLFAMSQNAALNQRRYFTWERVVEELQGVQRDILSSKSQRTQLQGRPLRLGVMTTWNQQCGLSTYAESLVREIPTEQLFVYSEYTDGQYSGKARTRDDEPFVRRCWSFQEARWEEMVYALERDKIEVLLLNLHNPKQLIDGKLGELLNETKQRGIRTVLLLHTIFTRRVDAIPLLQSVDQIVVHTPEMKVEVAAYGISPERISVVPHGLTKIPPVTGEEKLVFKESLGLPKNVPLLTTLGFIQPHKGIEGMIEALRVLNHEGIQVHGVIAGRVQEGDAEGERYAKKVHELIHHFGLTGQVTFLERYLDDEQITQLILASDMLCMNYRSDHYESSGVCARAIGAGADVITSVAPAFLSFGACVWHATTGFSIALGVREILRNTAVQQVLHEERQRFIATHEWPHVAQRLHSILRGLMVTKIEESAVSPQYPNNTTKQLRVLIQNRSNMLTQRGGDTIVVEKLIEGLAAKGVDVELDLEAKKDPRGFDLVHIINFALPQFVEVCGQRAKAAGVPFVVTTLCEDVPSFHHQSRVLAEALIEYVRSGQNSATLHALQASLKRVDSCQPFQNSWSAENAARLIVNGAGEQRVIEGSYPQHAPIRTVPVGYELGAEGSRAAFVREYGLEDFILCVGRLESRKNQLMLQLALEDLDLPVVFASGGFSYQPDYADAVRQFRRKGKTLVLDHLSPEMLASAYHAAKVHALPSWYELPGLVSLEAGILGCNIVASNTGTTRDYLGDFGFYCSPDDVDSIRNAVLAAYYAPYRAGIANHIKQFSWEAATAATLAVYEEVLGRKVEYQPLPKIQIPLRVIPELTAEQKSQFEEFSTQGFEAAQKRDFATAHYYLQKAEQIDAHAVRVLCNRAAVFLAEENATRAKEYFERARIVSPGDLRAQLGFAMCLMMEGRKEEAYGEFVAVLEREPTDMVAILQLLDCSYSINRFHDLERFLERFLAIQPDNFDMRYCLAGCCIRQNQLARAKAEIQTLLTARPGHGGTLELQQVLSELEERNRIGSSPEQVKSSVIEIEKTPDPRGLGNQKPIPSFDSIDLRLSELEELKSRKELDTAQSGIEELLRRGDLSAAQRVSAELLQAEVLAVSGERDKAQAIFQRHYEADGKNPRALCGLAAIAASHNDLERAKSLFEQSLAIQPSFDKALAGLGFCNLYGGDYPKAWDFYSAALDSNSENLSALFGLVQLAYHLKRLPQLEVRLNKYLEMHPADLEMVYAYAGCLYAQHRLDEAMGEVEKILLFRPDDSRAAELHGVIRQQMASAHPGL